MRDYVKALVFGHDTAISMGASLATEEDRNIVIGSVESIYRGNLRNPKVQEVRKKYIREGIASLLPFLD